ncbi:alpha/beta hydrolase [bacterium]|nr:MAG: alpha/beta hydrolase [bacterium]
MAIFCYDPAPQNERPVLLLHGLGADGRSWGFQMPALIEAGFRPLAPDLPGFGRSPVSQDHWDIPSITAQVVDWLTCEVRTPLPVVGISMGGAIALQMALTRADVASRLVLVNTFACLRPRNARSLAYLMRRFVLAMVRGSASQAEMVAYHLFPNPDQIELRQAITRLILESDPRAYRMAMRALALFDARKDLGQVHVPTLVITAALDTTVPRAVQDELAREIPAARQVIIPEARHAVVADQPERFNVVLLAFLQSPVQPVGESRWIETPRAG